LATPFFSKEAFILKSFDFDFLKSNPACQKTVKYSVFLN